MKAGWVVKPLGDVARLHYGKALAKAERNPEGDVPIYGANGVLGWSDHILTEGPSLIVGRKGSAGEVNRADGPFWPSDVTYYTEHDASKLDFEFFHYGMLTLDIPSLAKGVKPGINRNEAYALDFPIPPLEEQKRIVAVLDAAFEGLTRAKENAEANLQNARELFESTVTALLSNPASDWERGRLIDFCEKITVGHVGPMASKYVDSGVPFLRSQNVRPFQIDLENVKFIDDAFHKELKKSELCPGDVAIVRTGYPGTSAVIPEELAVVNCADLVIAKTGPKLTPHFLSLLLNSDYGKNLVAAAAVGAAQKHFNVGAAKQALFDFPPVEVQRELVAKLDIARSHLASLERIGRTKLIDISDLRQSLLQKAFAGELT